jgi:hypothetical protein
MDYSQNPYQAPKQPSGSNKSMVYVVFGICLLVVLLMFGFVAGMVNMVQSESIVFEEEGVEPQHAIVQKTAPDGWITYNLEDLNLTVELPASVESRATPPTDDEHGTKGYESWGEAAFMFIDRWEYGRRESHTEESTSDYDIESHQDWVDKNTLSSKFGKSEIAGIPAYHGTHTYKMDGEPYICHAYYLIGADWFTMIDISYPESDKHKGEAEMQRILKSMKFEKLDGLVRQL